MKIMHISDLHLGIIVNGINMIEDQKYSLDQILDEIDIHEIDVLIIAGDIYDKSNPSLEALNLFDNFINKLVSKNIFTLIISGNHDSSVRLEYLSSFLKEANIYISKSFNLEVEKIAIEDEFGIVNFYLLPFFKLSTIRSMSKIDFKNYDEAIKYLFKDKLDLSERNVLVAHQYVNGAVTSESEEIMVGGLEGISYESLLDFDYVALGHIHKPQKIKRDTIRYCGTLIKYSFSEANNEKSIPVIELKNKNDLEINLVPLNYLHDLKEIKGTYMELYNHVFCEDYTKIVLTDEEPVFDARANLLSVFPNMMIFKIENSKTNIEYALNETPVIEKYSPMELFSEFYKMQNNGVSPNNSELQIIKKIVEED